MLDMKVCCSVWVYSNWDLYKSAELMVGCQKLIRDWREWKTIMEKPESTGVQNEEKTNASLALNEVHTLTHKHKHAHTYAYRSGKSQVCTHTYVHTNIYTYTYTYEHTSTCKHVHKLRDSCTHTSTDSPNHTSTQSHFHTLVHTLTYPHTQAYIHMYTHLCTHTHMYTHTRTKKHTQTLIHTIIQMQSHVYSVCVLPKLRTLSSFRSAETLANRVPSSKLGRKFHHCTLDSNLNFNALGQFLPLVERSVCQAISR